MNNIQIKNYQQGDGSFLDYQDKSSVLYTSLILSCLNCCEDSSMFDDVKENAVKFLLSQKNNDWIFSDELNTNFCALAAVAEYNKELIDGAGIAKILMLLTSMESKEGGPYYSPGNVIDPLTNANITRFLSSYEVVLPNLEQFSFDSVNEMISALNLQLTPALSLALDLKRSKKEKDIFDASEQRMLDMIIEAAQRRFSILGDEFKNAAINRIKETIQGNPDKQMSLMAYYMKQALGRKGEKISDDIVAEMGLANIFFWTAFIIYDDFWDEDEAAQPSLLPIANLYARSYVDFFSSFLPEETGFRSFFHKLMDGLDAANRWENIYCRTKVQGNKFFIPENLPDYGDYEFKFQPSSGHILGSVAMLVSLGYQLDSSEVQNLIAYFKNYLIAMQINDDAHDWEEDIKRGHLSTVVVMLLKDIDWKSKEIDLEKDLPDLKKTFWFKTVVKASETVLFYTERSKQALDSIKILENIAPLERFIKINENIAKKAIREQKDSVDFLRTYKN